MTSQNFDNFVIDLSGGWKMFACGDGIAVHDTEDNHVSTIKGISLEKAAQVFNLGWQVGHISTTVNLKGKLVETVTRPPLALDPDESLPPSVAEAIARANADAPDCLKDRSVPVPHEPAVRHSPNAKREEIDGFVHWTED